MSISSPTPIGDGLEDQAELFWENKGDIRSPIGMDLTPPEYSRGQGVFVATKSNCVLIADTDGDDRAEEPIVVATGWPESFHQVDALGVAVDPRDQSIYFGLGTTNFADAYVKSPDGTATYTLDGEQGTIMRVAPDFKSREIVATGIRFPVALRFNAAAIYSAPIKKAPPGCPTAIRSTSCCTSKKAGTTASRRGTRGTCRT